ncbi:MAG: class I SAM-dependent methyltransferase [Pseudomonadota bacterium]
MWRSVKASVRGVVRRYGPPRRGFYTRYKYIDSAPWVVDRYDEIGHLFKGFEADLHRFLDLIQSFEASFAASATGPDALEWRNHWIPPLDGAAIYAVIAGMKPARVIEVGSGISTHLMARALRDHGTGTRITCIDPQPRRAIEALPVTIERRILSAADAALTDTLAAGDVLFIDSSHFLQPGFDVDIVLNRLLPRLAEGVIVHFHDVFLPYSYPANWERRRYNEQNALASLIYGGGFDLLFASNYAARDMAGRVRALCPGFPMLRSSAGGSLWLIKRGPAYRPAPGT